MVFEKVEFIYGVKVPIESILTKDEIRTIDDKCLSQVIEEKYGDRYYEWFHLYKCCTEINNYLIFGLKVRTRDRDENRDCFSYEGPIENGDKVLGWDNIYFKFNNRSIDVQDIQDTFVTVDFPVSKAIQERVNNQIHTMLPTSMDDSQVYLMLDDCTSCS